MLRVRALRLLAVLCVGVLHAPSASAWDAFGHHVVCAIAWDAMDEPARKGAAELLLKAPADSDLPSLMPPGPRPWPVRARELFIKSCAWSDIVRDELFPARKEAYDRPTWHYVNRFWRSSSGGEGYEALPERGTLGDLVEQLNAARAHLSDASRAEDERAIDLAWALHLTGDVHQPLHSSARVTASEPEGDRGGNDFALDADDPLASNLHAYWDGILRRARGKYHSEGYFGWVTRVATELEELHPEVTLAEGLSETSVSAWSEAAARIAMTRAYPPDLVRGAAPPRSYQERVFVSAARQAALAGYRIAAMMNAAFP